MADYYVDLNATESEIKSITSDLADIVREKSNDGKVVGIQKNGELNKLVAVDRKIHVTKDGIATGDGNGWLKDSKWKINQRIVEGDKEVKTIGSDSPQKEHYKYLENLIGLTTKDKVVLTNNTSMYSEQDNAQLSYGKISLSDRGQVIVGGNTRVYLDGESTRLTLHDKAQIDFTDEGKLKVVGKAYASFLGESTFNMQEKAKVGFGNDCNFGAYGDSYIFFNGYRSGYSNGSPNTQNRLTFMVEGAPRVHIRNNALVIIQGDSEFNVKDKSKVHFNDNAYFVCCDKARVIFEGGGQSEYNCSEFVVGGPGRTNLLYSGHISITNGNGTTQDENHTIKCGQHYYGDNNSDGCALQIDIHDAPDITINGTPRVQFFDAALFRMSGCSLFSMTNNASNSGSYNNTKIPEYGPSVSLDSNQMTFQTKGAHLQKGSKPYSHSQSDGPYTDQSLSWNYFRTVEENKKQAVLQIQGTTVVIFGNTSYPSQQSNNQSVWFQVGGNGDTVVLIQGDTFLQTTGKSHIETHDGSTVVMRGKLKENIKPWEDYYGHNTYDDDSSKLNDWCRPIQIPEDGPLFSMYDEAGFIMRGRYPQDNSSGAPESWSPNVARKKDSPIAELIDEVELRLAGNFKCETKNTDNDIEIIISNNSNEFHEDNDNNNKSVTFTLTDLQILKEMISNYKSIKN